jgi:hypothetical protein
MLPFLINSANILSHLATLNVNLTFHFYTECRWEWAEDLSLVGQINSTTRDPFDSPPEQFIVMIFILGLRWSTIFMPAFCTMSIIGGFWCSRRSNLWSQTVCEQTGRSGTIFGLSSRVGQHLRPLWWALCDSGLYGVGYRTIWRRARRPRSCVDGPAVLRDDLPYNKDGGNCSPGYEPIGIPKYS